MKGSLNKYAGQIIKEGIFNNIANFDELNLRLSNIKSSLTSITSWVLSAFGFMPFYAEPCIFLKIHKGLLIFYAYY